MADEGDILTDLDLDPAAGANGADNQPSVGFLTQYIKDLSVENPNAPASLQWNEAPQVDLQLNIGATEAGDGVHEVEVRVNASAKAESGVLYAVELVYAGLVAVRNFPEDQAHAFLYAEAPRILFPFARAIVADATRDAGFQPLLLDPIDFNALYMQRLQQKAQEEAQSDGAAGDGTPPADPSSDQS